jgi:hypothetical protein
VESPRFIAPTPVATTPPEIALTASDAAPEPPRMIAPAAVTEPVPVAEPAAVLEQPRATPAKASTTKSAAARPAVAAPRVASAKPRPRVTKVRVEQPALDEDPEVAKFMAALRGLPDVQVVDTPGEAVEPEPPRADDIDVSLLAAADAGSAPVQAAATPPVEAEQETPKHDAAVPRPKTVRALNPTRVRAVPPIAPARVVPPGTRKRVTPINRVTPSAAATAAQGGADGSAAPDLTTPIKVVGRIQPSSSSQPAVTTARPKEKKTVSRGPRPIQDEWGFFDPDQCGFPAVQAKLEEIEEPDLFRTATKPTKPRS